MQLKKLQEKQGIKPAMKQNSMTIALEAQLRINSQPKKGDVKLEWDTSKIPIKENQRESCNTLQDIGWPLQRTKLTPRTTKRYKVNVMCVNKDAVSCIGVQVEPLGAQKRIAVVYTNES